MLRITSLPVKPEESKEIEVSVKPESIPIKKFMKAPHEFFATAVPSTSSASNLLPTNIDTSISSSNNLTRILPNQLIQPPDKMISNSSSSSTLQSVPSRWNEPKSIVSLNPHTSILDEVGGIKSLTLSDNVEGKYPLSSTSVVPTNNGVQGNQERYPSVNYEAS